MATEKIVGRQIQDNTIPNSKLTTFTQDQNFGGFKGTNALDPTNPQDLATKNYADNLFNGARDFKENVRVASTVDYATWAADSFTGQTNSVDGVTVVNGDRILVKSQSSALQNGIYTVTSAGTGANGVWTRASDFDTSADATSGSFMWVSEGSVNADSGWLLTTDDPITLDTTALTFTQISGLYQVTAGGGIDKTGNTLNIVWSGIETPSGAVNGSNTVYVTANSPYSSVGTTDAAAVEVRVNGLVQTPTTHYTRSGSNITLGDAPATGERVTVSYFVA